MVRSNADQVDRIASSFANRLPIKKGSSPDVVYFLGVGQSGSMLTKIEASFPGEVIAVGAAPYFSLRIPADIERLGEELVSQSVSVVKVEENKYDLYAESQAAPSVIQALAGKRIPVPRRLILIAPLGLNYNYLGKTVDARYDELMRRSIAFWRHPNQSLSQHENFITFLNVMKERLMRPTFFKKAYTIGANQDTTKALATIAKITQLHIFAGDKDSLFPYEEIKGAIGANNDIKLHLLPGSTHLNRATKLGIRQLKEIIASTLK